MRKEGLEPRSLLSFEYFLIRIELLGDRLEVEIIVRHHRIFPDNRHAIVPTPIFCAVVEGTRSGDFESTPELQLLLEQRVVILFEQTDELVGHAPPSFVVVLHYERLVRDFRLSALGLRDCTL